MAKALVVAVLLTNTDSVKKSIVGMGIVQEEMIDSLISVLVYITAFMIMMTSVPKSIPADIKGGFESSSLKNF